MTSATSADDVMDFWSKNARVGIYPTLCLSASAASVPVESMFTTAGLVVNSKRSSISADGLGVAACICLDSEDYIANNTADLWL